MTRCTFAVIDDKGARACGAPAIGTRTVHGVEFDVCATCAAVIDANPADPKAQRLSTAPRSLLADIRSAFDDLDAVGLDLLRPLRRRNLGTREHQRLYHEARRKLLQLLTPPDNDTEHGDPAGSGGAGAE